MKLNLTLAKKRILLVFGAILILSIAFSLNTKQSFKNKNDQNIGLTYKNKTLLETVNLDTDLDGIVDWEEGLWGTDPLKVDTDDNGESDFVEINKLKTNNNNQLAVKNLDIKEGALTKTDELSREVFSTVAALNQAGSLDHTTATQLGESLAEQIQNPTTNKVFLLSDIKITTTNSTESYKAYFENFENILSKQKTLYKEGYEKVVYIINITLMPVLQKYISSPNEDDSMFSQLDNIVTETKNIVKEMQSLTVPANLSLIHLDILNGFQKVSENIESMKLAVKDPVVAMGGANKYEENGTILENSLNKLKVIIDSLINN